jgi:predicted GH43/DUF377 family glycosyl hydrolase
MIKVEKLGVVLKKTKHNFENEGVLNPGCIKIGEEVHMFYRAVRKGNHSSIGHCIFDGPVEIKERFDRPVLFPEHEYESKGLEDPRIVKLDDQYYVTYSAYDSINVRGAIAVTCDFHQFKKLGPITPEITYEQYKQLIECNNHLNVKYYTHYNIFVEHGLEDEIKKMLIIWDKNLILFPRKINGRFALLHRLFPGIQLVLFNDFSDLTKEFWEEYLLNLEKYIIMDPEFHYESSHIGGGCPPIETKEGWLTIYHAVEDTPKGLCYSASAAMLDLNDPHKVTARLRSPLFYPTEKYEKNGYVNNVCFPSGTALFGDDLYVYYGAADASIAVAKMSLKELIEELRNNKIQNEDSNGNDKPGS